MIDLYTWTTPNGYKASIALEELGLPYRAVPINIGKGDQFDPEFLKISPNNRIPAIVDQDGPDGKPIALFESGAILLYLAEKTGKLLPRGAADRYRAIEWLVFQVANTGPMFGQLGHFKNYAPEKIPYAIERYSNETKRLYGVLDRRLKESEYLAGEYSIADVANFPWVRNPAYHGIEASDYPHLARWRDAIAARPAVQRGLLVPHPRDDAPAKMDEKTREVLFGKTQYERR
jgi:GST-like protein